MRCLFVCVCVFEVTQGLYTTFAVCLIQIWLFHGKLTLMNDTSAGGRWGNVFYNVNYYFIIIHTNTKKFTFDLHLCTCPAFLCKRSWRVSLYTSGCEKQCVWDPLQRTWFSHPTVLVLPWGVWERSVTAFVSELIAGNDQRWVVPSTSKSLHPDCGLPLWKWSICAHVCTHKETHNLMPKHTQTFI